MFSKKLRYVELLGRTKLLSTIGAPDVCNWRSYRISGKWVTSGGQILPKIRVLSLKITYFEWYLSVGNYFVKNKPCFLQIFAVENKIIFSNIFLTAKIRIFGDLSYFWRPFLVIKNIPTLFLATFPWPPKISHFGCDGKPVKIIYFVAFHGH
jgi:hypothetical protein